MNKQLQHQYKLSEPFNYQNDYEYASNDQFSFWNDVAKKYVHWDKEYSTVYDDSKNEWFKGGLVNMCYNALDKHIINGRGDQVAFIQEIPLKQITYQITYQQLYDKVCRLSRSLKNLGIGKGDVVLIYMHNCFELIISMLSCARIGAIHNILFGFFLADTLIDTINRSKPVAIILSNHGYMFTEINSFYDSILDAYSNPSICKPKHTILYQRKDFNVNGESLNSGADLGGENEINILNNNISGSSSSSSNNFNFINWDELISDQVEPLLEYELLEPNHPLYVLFSSGTTNKPKAIQRETAGKIVGANYSLRSNYGLKPGDTFFSKASISWINGHTMIVYGCLLVGVKSIFLEGSFKDSVLDFWTLIEKYKVNVISTTPIAVRTLIKNDPSGEIASKFNLSNIKKVTISAEKTHQSLLDYLKKVIGKSIVCNEYGLTESSGVLIVNASNQLSIQNDSIGKPTPGYNIKIVSKDNSNIVIENKANEIGEIVIKLPVFPYVSLSHFDDDENKTLFKEYYLNEFNGYLRTKDLGYYDENGLWYYHSRSDDSISVGGYTLSTAVIENETLKHQSVNDCCVIGLDDEINYQVPIGLIVLQDDITSNYNLNSTSDLQSYNQFINRLKEEINTIITNTLTFGANLQHIIIVNEFPKTKSGKKLKSLITSIFNNKQYSIPSSIQDVKSIDHLIERYQQFNQFNNNKKS